MELTKMLIDQEAKARENSSISKSIITKAKGFCKDAIANIKKNPTRVFFRLIASISIGLIGSFLTLDKFMDQLGIQLDYCYGYTTSANFIWVLMQSLVPILLILFFLVFKPYKIAYIIPVYCYGLQLFWVFNDRHSDKSLQEAYALGCCLLFVFVVFVLKKISSISLKKEDDKDKIIELSQDIMQSIKEELINQETKVSYA